MTFEYSVIFPDETEEIIEFEVDIINSGIGGFEMWGKKCFDQGPEIDLIEFNQNGLNLEQIKYIEDEIIPSDNFQDRIWDEYEKNS